METKNLAKKKNKEDYKLGFSYRHRLENFSTNLRALTTVYIRKNVCVRREKKK